MDFQRVFCQRTPSTTLKDERFSQNLYRIPSAIFHYFRTMITAAKVARRLKNTIAPKLVLDVDELLTGVFPEKETQQLHSALYSPLVTTKLPLRHW